MSYEEKKALAILAVAAFAAAVIGLAGCVPSADPIEISAVSLTTR